MASFINYVLGDIGRPVNKNTFIVDKAVAGSYNHNSSFYLVLLSKMQVGDI